MTPAPFEGKGWKLSFHFERRSGQESWIRPNSSIKEMFFLRSDHSVSDIRKAIKEKASHYPPLDHPFIIAINIRRNLVSPDAVFEALYGSVSHVYDVVRSEGETIGDLRFSHFQSLNNGSFRARGPQNTRVGAVWIANGLSGPSTIGSAELYEVENHYAEKRFQPDFPSLRSFFIDDEGKPRVRGGLTAQEIIGIANHWPEDNPRPKIDFSEWFCE
jgi:hypothetical protein